MNARPASPVSQRGAALLIAAVFLLVIITLIGGIGLRLAGTDITDTALQSDSVEALFLAESGLERAMQRLAGGTDCAALVPDAVQTLGRGDFHIESAVVNGSLCSVQVRGRVLVGGVMRAQRVIAGDLALASGGWAVGNNGTILIWNGSEWADTGSGATNRNLNGLYCVTADDCWAVGDRRNHRGTIVRLSGGTWTNTGFPTNSSPNENLNAIHCLSGSQCWAVGDNGTLVRWNGSSWTNAASPTGDDLNGVTCVAADNCWAVGDDGTIVHWNGSSWTNAASPTGDDLNGVTCVAADNCWAVGDDGTIVRWNGSSWTNAASPTGDDLNGVTCVAADNCWAVGDDGTVALWNGSNWTTASSQTGRRLSAIAFPAGTAGGSGLRAWRELIL